MFRSAGLKQFKASIQVEELFFEMKSGGADSTFPSQRRVEVG